MGWGKDGVIVGFVSVYVQDGFIHNLFVHPGAQGQGVGRALLAFGEKILTAKNPSGSPMRLTLKVAMDNAGVGNFYEKQGWSLVSIHDQSPAPYYLYGKYM